MRVVSTVRRRVCVIAWILAGLIPSLAAAQTAEQTPSRIAGPVDESALTVLKGNVYPLATAKFDRGAAPDSLPMERMLLVLKRSPQQESALQALLDGQQDKSSPNYHKWLTPEEFGKQFGPSDQDIQAVTGWLTAHGFQVTQVANGRMVIEFSGTAGLVKQAFHTEIHKYVASGEAHWANANDPQIPTALTPVVAGVNTLHNFPRKAMSHLGGPVIRSKDTGRVIPTKPLFTLPQAGGCGVQSADCYAVGPYDFATIYNVLPLWNGSPAINGTGQTIAIVGETDINPQDVADFRNFFGLPAPPLQVIHNGPAPGILTDGEEAESDLDVEWSGAVAPGAMIDFVVTESTETSLGVDLSAEYIIDNNLAPVMSESYGVCELGLGQAGNQFFSQLWQQGAAQGITVFLASGDSGSATCDSQNNFPPAPAQFGLQVSGFASTPYNVAVGGTDFYDWTTAANYWNSSNTATTQASAKSYIPETTWNDTCTNGVFGALLGFSTNAETNCNNSQLVNFVVTVGGSGGKSNCTASDGANPITCTGGYDKPAWQSALTPNDRKRDIPDLSLFAAAGSPSGSFYVICEADLISGGTSCQPSDPSTGFLAIGGTSASSPAMAGVMALVNQSNGGRQGNANYVFYKLAALQQPSACNSTNGSGSSCVFNDVTNGTNAMPCAAGAMNCTPSAGHSYGVLPGYSTTSGYDLATGLGSVNASNLVKKWSSVSFLGSQTTLTLSPTSSLSHGQAVNVTVQVKPASGTGTPTGAATLMTSTGQSIQGFTLLQNGQVTGTTDLLPGGSYTVTAQYGGDGTYGTSTSNAVSVAVAKENSLTTPRVITFTTNGQILNNNATTMVYGSPYLLRVDVTNAAGATCGSAYSCATGSVTLTNNGSPLDTGAFTLNNLGYFEDQTIQLTGGSHALVAQYPGDSSFNASSATDSVTVTQAVTTTSVNTSSATVVVGTTVNLSSSTQSQSSGAFPTGTVTFFVDGKAVPGTPTYGTSIPAGGFVALNANLAATLSTAGNHNITASYAGDTNYASSTAAAVPVSVLYSTSTSLMANPQTVQYPNNVTVTALVDTTTKTPAPTGTVAFTGVGGQITGNVSYATVTDASGNAALQATLTYAPSFNDTISANYSGDVNFASSSMIGLAITVNGGPAANFTLPKSPAGITIPAPGTGGNTNILVTSVGGFAGTVGFTCAVPASMKEATCSVTPSTFVPVNGSGSITLAVSTTAAHAVGTLHWPGWLAHGGGLIFAAVLAGGLRRKKFPLAALLVVLTALALSNVGCGGGSGGQTDPGTPAGTYTVGVTGTSGSLTQTANVSVTVQ